MKRGLYLTLLIITIFAAIAVGYLVLTKQHDGSSLFAKKIKPIKVDGKLTEWQTGRWYNLNSSNLSKHYSPNLKHKGDEDLSASFAIGWNSAGLSIALKVMDNIHTPSTSPYLNWKSDALHLFFNPANNTVDNKQSKPDERLIIYIAQVNKQPVAFIKQGPQPGVAKAIQSAISRQGSTTIYEVFIPAAQLPGITFKPGTAVGFSLLVNDNDRRGRKAGVTTSPAGSDPIKTAHQYRDLILIEN